jgi:hypothetical protein
VELAGADVVRIAANYLNSALPKKKFVFGGNEMTIRTIDESQRSAARVAGFTCLFIMATAVFAHYGIYVHLSVVGDAAATARNIMAHERLFRIVIACGLIYGVGVVLWIGIHSLQLLVV